MRPITIKSVLFVFASLSLFTAAGCQKDAVIENVSVPRLLIESRGVNYGGMGGTVVTLPVSGTSIPVQQEPLVNEFEILNVEMVQVDMGLAMLVQLSPKGARDLYRGSVSNMGGRVVLSVNGNAVGARRIDGAIQDGNFYTFVEIDDSELGQLVLDIKETLAEIQKKK
jgi:hypothetical protein